MNAFKSLLLIFLLALATGCFQHADAQHFNMDAREWSTLKKGAPMLYCWQNPPASPAPPCDTLLCQVDFFNNPSVVGSNFKIKENRSFVKFSVDHSDAKVYDPYSYMISYQVRGYKQLNSTTPSDVFVDTLMISYKPDSVHAFQDIHMRSYYGYYRIEVKIIEFFDYTLTFDALRTGAATIPPPVDLLTNPAAMAAMKTNWQIEAGMALQKFDVNLPNGNPSNVYSSTMSGITLHPQHTVPASSNTLHITWDGGAPDKAYPAMYELEWLYKDNYKASISGNSLSVTEVSPVSYDFGEGASRIITSKAEYDIPLVYKNGWIIYRVRLLRPDDLNYKETKYGPWSNTNNTGTVSTAAAGFYKIQSAHLGNNTNWNFNASYAEEGKTKQVLSYYDGLLKDRQTLTRFGSRPNEVIAMEKFYDYEGRVGLQTLPVPVIQSNATFGYVNDFAVSAATSQPYKAQDIDQLHAPNVSPSLLPGLSGSAAGYNYYSPANSLLAGGNTTMKALPDAEGFPLIQTKYDPDDPTRIRMQGGAGKELQLGKGHETHYYYSDPEQFELNLYQGANSGWAKFYEKIITRDPNQEFSFSIINNKGKPVMTGLMGFPDPANGKTLLNVDGVTVPAPPYPNAPVSNLFLANPPLWAGNVRTFNKTIFREAPGGFVDYKLKLPAFQPCPSSNLRINLPVTYSVTAQGDADVAPQSVIAATTALPATGTATAATITNGANDINVTVAGVSMPGGTVGEQTIDYKASYNPDFVDTAIKQYLRETGLYPSCYKTPQDFLSTELQYLPENCEGEATEITGNECRQQEAIMAMQLMPQGVYGIYERMGNSRTVVGNRLSIFAIVGWKVKDVVATPGYVNVFTAPGSSNLTTFEPTCWPSTGILSPPSSDLADMLDFYSQYFVPEYAYQHYTSGFAADVTVNGNVIRVDQNTNVNTLIELFNRDVAMGMLQMHPEYCEYDRRYCDVSDFAGYVNAIPNATVAANMNLFTLDELIAADPFSVDYTGNGGTAADLKYMSYLSVDGSNVPTGGTRQVAIDYFAYLKVTCEASSNPDNCWYNALVANTSNPLNYSGSGTLATAVAALSAPQRDIYYRQLTSMYLAGRGNKIAAYRISPYACVNDHHLQNVDNNNLVFREDLAEVANAPGPPAYTDIINTTSILTNIGTQTTNAGTPGNALNDLDAYAEQIVKKLQNCRVPGNPYDAALFSDLLNDLKTKMQDNVANGKDKIWKGGITPDVMKHLLTARNITPDDLCNPFLIDYSLSASASAYNCNTGPTNCLISERMDFSKSFLKVAQVDLLDRYLLSPSTTSLSGTTTVAISSANTFERTLLRSLGYPLSTTSLTFNWTIGGPNDEQLLTFNNGSKQVTIKIVRINTAVYDFLFINTAGNLSKELSHGVSVNNLTDFYQNYAAQCSCSKGGYTYFRCYDEITDGYYSPLYLYGSYLNKSNFTAANPNTGVTKNFTGYTIDMAMTISGLDFSEFRYQPDSADFSKPCAHTCIACNELKEAYNKYQLTMNNYGVKGKGHPYYETSLRSFLNYYFRNNHHTDEYLDFMKGCNLTDGLFEPQYYGYFQASGTAAEVQATLSHILAYQAAAPGSSVSPNNQLLGLQGVRYLRYEDDNAVEHLYIDFNTVYQDGRLRPFIDHLDGWLRANTSSLTWYFNQLEGDFSSADKFSVDVFLPGVNAVLPVSVPGLSATPENVFVKDDGLQMKFTHYHFVLTVSNESDLAGQVGTLASDVKAYVDGTPADDDNYIFFSTYESYRNTHGNTLPDKMAYLAYAYGLWTGASHDLILSYLSASTVQSNVYSTGGIPSKDVSYRHGTDGNPDDPSGTLQLSTPSSGTPTSDGLTFLHNVLEYSKYSYSGQSAPSIAPGNVFQYAVYPLPRPLPSVLQNLSFGSRIFYLLSVKAIPDHMYAFRLRESFSTTRDYNVYLKVPDYISRERVLKYEIVLGSLLPVARDGSKRYFKVLFRDPNNTADAFEALGKTDFDLVSTAPDVYRNVMLCDNQETEAGDSITICYEQLLQDAVTRAEAANSQYQDSLYTSLRFAFRQHISDNLSDGLSLSSPQMKYAITLYNYDRAGNLIATVPPMGVKTLSALGTYNDASYSMQVDEYRRSLGANYQPFVPPHTKKTEYQYDFGNRKIYESTPDGGVTRYFYDEAGRLMFSQNSRQQPDNKYTYMLYDGQNRVVETGQVKVNGLTPLHTYIGKLGDLKYDEVTPGTAYMKGLIENMVREEVVKTWYDAPMYTYAAAGNGLGSQENLRSRIASVASYKKLTPGSVLSSSFTVALHYSYDLSGNVKTLVYDMPGLAAERQRYKRIDYDYDLYSGKVNLVSYNRSFADQFYQRYTYDDDNRITKTETSKDGVLWDRDAQYEYYPHGPLARVSLGDLRVQGIDFAYTLQGWLKSINGDGPGADKDMGGDGTGNSATQPDLYRTAIAYFDGDYKPLNATDASNATGTTLLRMPPPDAATRSLYNGNIAGITSSPGYFPSLYTAYRYDKLNRIKSADYLFPDYTATNPLSAANVYGITDPAKLYQSSYTYDLDGNLLGLTRYGFKNGSAGDPTGGTAYKMDDLGYIYNNGFGNAYNNKLTNYTDQATHVSTSGFTNDIPVYAPGNAASVVRLEYDNTGNLVKDVGNGIKSIDWTLYGKTAQVTKDDGHRLGFIYDPLGNRLSKTNSYDNPDGKTTALSEYYIRDASGGNILATYRQVQRFHYEAPYLELFTQASTSPDFGVHLAQLLGNNAGFNAALMSGTLDTASGFADTRIAALPVSAYLEGSQLLRGAALDADSAVIPGVIAGNDSLITYLYPGLQEPDLSSAVAVTDDGTGAYNEHFLDPVLTGLAAIADGAGDDKLHEIIRYVAAMMGNSEVRTAYLAQQHIPDISGTPDAADIAQSLVEELVSETEPARSAFFHDLLWLMAPGTAGQQLYRGAVKALLHDSTYLHAACSSTPGNLRGYLRNRVLYLTGGVANTDTGLAIPPGSSAGLGEGPFTAGQTSAVKRLLGSYFAGRYSAPGDVPGLDGLDSRETMLYIAYGADKGDFITGLQAEPEGGSVISKAMSAASGMSLLSMVDGLQSLDPGGTEIELNEVMDYDKLYLSEHHLYGSSRLGVKSYWPTQYRYEWDMQRTNAENQASLDSSEFSYRRPWYGQDYGSLIAHEGLEPYGHANTDPVYSERFLGLKRYELTNHLGNVMAVTTDKVTEVPASGTTLPTTAVKRASLSATYDYYPFGMLMPERYTEDTGTQCAMVTRYRRTMQLQTAAELNKTTANVSAFTPTQMTVSSSGTGVRAQSDFWGGDVTTSFSPVTAGRAVAVTVNVTNAGTAPYVRLIQDGNILTSAVASSTSNSLTLTATPPTSSPLRLYVGVYEASPNDFTIGEVVYKVYSEATEAYVTKACNVDTAFSEDYKFGFNGQMKDNEIAGVGNHNTALFWEYDTRLGRRWNLDPKPVAWESQYATNANNPILNRDVLGDQCCNRKPPPDERSPWQKLKDDILGVGIEVAKDATTSIIYIGQKTSTPSDIFNTHFYPISHADGIIATVKTALFIGVPEAIEADITIVSRARAFTRPQGMSSRQFSRFSRSVRSGAEHISEDIFVQGSRASHTARAESDIDIAIKVDEKDFNALIEKAFGKPNPGSAKERTMQNAIKTGKIQAGEAGLRSLRKSLEAQYGMEVDISIVKKGGSFDNGVQMPLKSAKK